MLCDKCKKNIATVHVEAIVNDGKTVHNLCAACAAGLSIQMDFASFLDSFMQNVFPGGKTEAVADTCCKSCGLSFSQFQKTGRFGCAHCYRDFEPQTEVILKNTQGSNRHEGKIPRRLGAEIGQARTLEKLRQSLRKAVENEEYEEAARLRDTIKAVEAGRREVAL